MLGYDSPLRSKKHCEYQVWQSHPPDVRASHCGSNWHLSTSEPESWGKIYCGNTTERTSCSWKLLVINSELEIAVRVIRQSWKVHAPREVVTPLKLWQRAPALVPHLRGTRKPRKPQITNLAKITWVLLSLRTQCSVMTWQFTIQHGCCCDSHHLSTRGTLCHLTLCPNEEEDCGTADIRDGQASKHEEHLSWRNY